MVARIETLPPLPSRSQDAHKGTFGTALLIGGSRGMAGSISLAALSALRTGAGLVFVACPECCQDIVAGFDPSYLTVGLPQQPDGTIAYDAQELINSHIEKSTAVGIGPGLGQSRDAELLMLDLYVSVKQPLVIDADGLNALARLPDGIPKNPAGPRILTPHPGEMGRLLGISSSDVQSRRDEIAEEFAKEHNCVVVLKGFQTIVTDGETMFVNTSGNSGMATGGTGDVLTGLITSLLAQGLSPIDATRIGVHLHGVAGDLIAERYGERGLIASDLPLAIAEAIRQHR
ncbi:NAD(P)H-hydrate dehydratase [Rubinisphaera margarita]|uniref:NAD(P)H-hydrate dehydratase n=1 Tax=Rubinisphaera margarita TaxID=2909586 RepID=UPI001EE87ED5|nr:NAD(P)H-hydrate dehydratase [Rubinisphaera margarita]MCG6156608.1 NAD(P)H-hydrate dehydratase [Rubinisphaera margarita]